MFQGTFRVTVYPFRLKRFTNSLPQAVHDNLRKQVEK